LPLVARAHDAGLRVYAWTHAGTGQELQSLIAIGVDGVHSDNARVAREYVAAACTTSWYGRGGYTVALSRLCFLVRGPPCAM
jgi:hypothetical protein